ncbi:hypothetical protein RRG08_033151 [Elysia crispata]|uniref:Uncharacterized protein n=1 Tax=Elysia crispata TaxID=231223 RepID=A0AAE0YYK7_9GAST|nr:hypothetical protein RRG08_033151 [Elysia crispata]
MHIATLKTDLTTRTSRKKPVRLPNPRKSFSVEDINTNPTVDNSNTGISFTFLGSLFLVPEVDVALNA